MVCSHQTIVCSHQIVVCSRQTKTSPIIERSGSAYFVVESRRRWWRFNQKRRAEAHRWAVVYRSVFQAGWRAASIRRAAAIIQKSAEQGLDVPCSTQRGRLVGVDYFFKIVGKRKLNLRFGLILLPNIWMSSSSTMIRAVRASNTS